MAKASDNQFPKVLLTPVDPASITPPTGTQAVLLDSTDGNKLKRKAAGASGAVTAIEGAGGSGGAAGRVLLKEIVLSSAATTIDFTSSDIPTSGYRHLELRFMGRSAKAAVDQDIYLYANGDTTAGNYLAQRITATNGTLGAQSLAAGSIGYIPGASAAAGYAGLVRVELPNFLDTAFYQNAWHQSWTPNEPYTTHGPWTWKNTAAISALKISADNNFVAGTTAQLYGLV